MNSKSDILTPESLISEGFGVDALALFNKYGKLRELKQELDRRDSERTARKLKEAK